MATQSSQQILQRDDIMIGMIMLTYGANESLVLARFLNTDIIEDFTFVEVTFEAVEIVEFDGGSVGFEGHN